MPEQDVIGTKKKTLRLAVLISGAGRTLENLITLTNRGELPARIATVVSSRADVRGNAIAEEAGIPLAVVPRGRFKSTEEFSGAIYDALLPMEIDLVVMAGFLCKINVHPAFEGRIMNIHPSLLPLFGGKGLYGGRVHQAVLDSGMKISGCTVHFVNESYDAGPIILQTAVPVLDDDTPSTLAARVFQEERRAYPEAIRLFAAGRLQIEGQQVRILPPEDNTNPTTR